MLRPFIFLTVLLSFTVPAYAKLIDATHVQWGYKGNTGPIHWGQLNPDFALCASGKSQSPIDIPRKTGREASQLDIHYQSAPLEIIEDGTTELTIGQDQVIFDDGHGVQVNFHPQNKELITLNGKQYRLTQFHIHSPSENTWRGRAFPLEIHFVHQGENGEVAVIGVFVKGGESNSEIEKIVNNLPTEKDKLVVPKGQTINPINLLPDNRRLYTFDGSLTTPPCTEGLHWIVMPEPITATPAQIVELRKAANGVNARPIQPLHGRQINYTR